jgi:hypothetical protein
MRSQPSSVSTGLARDHFRPARRSPRLAIVEIEAWLAGVGL